jgi:hypothetical protein
VEIIALAGGAKAVLLRFVAAANKSYTVESRPAAEAGAWIRLSDIAASPTNRLVEILDTNGPPSIPARFYRLATARPTPLPARGVTSPPSPPRPTARRTPRPRAVDLFPKFYRIAAP